MIQPYDLNAVIAKLEARRGVDTLITLDYETFYSKDYGLKKYTTEAYVRDPQFQQILVGVKVNDEPATWTDPDSFAKWAATVDWSRVMCLAHHAHFDGLILAHHNGIRPAVWLDTLSMARALHGVEVGGSLAKLATHYGAGAKGHEVVLALGKRREDFTPGEFAAYGGYCANDVELTHKIFHMMMLAGFPESELWQIDSTVRWFTEPEFQTDDEKLVAYHASELARKQALLARIAHTWKRKPDDDPDATVRDVLMSNDKFAALLLELGVEPPRKFSTRTGKETYAFAKSDQGFKDLLEHEVEEIRHVAEARLGIKSTINETRTLRLINAGRRGPVPVYNKYAAAHTFRWGGGDKLNFQNLERANEKDATKGVIRKSLLAPEGNLLVVADSGQIEARVNAWLAGHTEVLEIFAKNDALGVIYSKELKARKRDGMPEKEAKKELAKLGIFDGDFYSDFGSMIYGFKINKDTHPDERQNSKSMALGLGFQMGWKKFAAEMLKGMMGAKPKIFTERDAEVVGFNLTRFKTNRKNVEKALEIPSRLPEDELITHCAVACAFVDLYRSRNAPIVEAWEDMEWVIEQMADGNEQDVGPNQCLRIVRHGIIGPNGLKLRYPGLERRKDENGFWSYSYLGANHGKGRSKIYGGLMDENLVQYLARVIVAEQLLGVRADFEEMFDGKPVTMTHDEGVFSVPKRHAEEALDHALEWMKRPPVWAPDLPLNAGGGIARAYGDAK